MGGLVARMELRNAFKTFVGTLERRRPLGGSMCRRQDNIKMNLMEKEWKGVNWILSQDREM